MGGEGILPPGPTRLCRHKRNELLLTHFDWDHLKFADDFQAQVSHFCWHSFKPKWIPKNKRKFVSQLTACRVSHFSHNFKAVHRHLPSAKNKNDRGKVYSIYRQLLIPGDQSKDIESIWTRPALKAISPNKLRILALAHHGSKHSTSSGFLETGRFHLAIASARRKRYGHPHKEVIEKLKTEGVALMTTETFGSIYIPIND